MLSPGRGNQEGFNRISDMVRMISIIMMILHFYHFCHPAFEQWHLASRIPDRILFNIYKTGLFNTLNRSKIIAFGLLFVSFFRKSNQDTLSVKYAQGSVIFLLGTLIFFSSSWVAAYYYPGISYSFYMILTSIGYFVTISAGSSFSGIFRDRLQKDHPFNSYNETFPQEERLIENEYSINLKAKYRYKDQIRNSWINIINPMRGTLICGTPGSGKTHYVVEQIIEQHIRKGFAMVIYDFKYPDLSILAYNCYLKYKTNYSIQPEFHYLNFDDPNFSDRCNFLHPDNLEDISDAAEFSRAFLLGLNKDWIEKQGDFWVESPINLLTAIIWFLRKYEGGRYCTFPHAIELLQADYAKLFSILSTQPEIETYVNPFKTAYLTESTKQLQGQVDGLKIAVARISSPKLYYILTGNDFTMDIANPKNPKILCIGNTPDKSQVYGAVISVYLSAIQKNLNKHGNLKTHIILEEFPTVYMNAIDRTLALSRSYNVSTTIVIQNFNQLKLYYGRNQSDVIFNLPGNIICGQSFGETARLVTERIGRILQNKESFSSNNRDLSVNHSQQLEMAVPQSSIAKLLPGEMVGVVAGNVDQKMEYHSFHSQVILKSKQDCIAKKDWKKLSQLRVITYVEVFDQFLKIKKETQSIISVELSRIINSPELSDLHL